MLDDLGREHGSAGVPFKVLENAARPRMDFRALKGSLDSLVKAGAVVRVSESPARLTLTEVGRKQLQTYRA